VVQSANPSLARRSRAHAAARIRGRLATTPGRMRTAGAAIVVGLLLLAVVGTGAVRARERATTAVGGQAEPLLLGAESLYSSLANADATATNTFLEAGLEPPARRQAYLNDLATAAAQLTKVAGQAGTAPAVTSALGVINKDLPIYSGMVESARANNLEGFPVGAAYLTEGSTLMQTQILPAAGTLYQVEAQRLNQAYDSGQSWLDVVGVLLAACVALALLVLAQGFVARRTNRLLNLPMLIASVLTLVVVAWTATAFTLSAQHLSDARHHGSDPIQLASSAQILVSRAQVDENLALVARGGDPQYLADFDAVVSALGSGSGSSGLVGLAGTYPGTDATNMASYYAGYLVAHKAVVAAESGGMFTAAVALATGDSSGDELPAAAQLTGDLSNEILMSQAAFTGKSVAASNDLSALSLGVIGLLIVAGALALVGMEQRINEYR